MKLRPKDAWVAALEIMDRLRAEGHVALLAGGCVRDRLLGAEPKDYDVVTDATPRRVHQLFPRAREVGAQFGVMLVRKYGHSIEVATFRADGPYSDGRHPDQVRFGSELEDARRRDFTINGLFLDPLGDRVIDHVGGRADLEAGIVRTIGDPDERFAEDHLRMLRAVRFAARLSFTVEPKTLAAIRRLGPYLSAISPERIAQELEAILTAPSRATGWNLLVDTGLRRHLNARWPADEPEDDLAGRRLAALPPVPIGTALAFGGALAAHAVTEVRELCMALRCSNRVSDAVVWLVSHLPTVRAPGAPGMELADLKMMMAHEHWDDLRQLLCADLTARGNSLVTFERICARADAVPGEEIAPRPLVTGEDLHAMGIPQGPRFGVLLGAAYREQLNNVVRTRDQALELIRRLVRG